jgi:serine/threonine-protein kinase
MATVYLAHDPRFGRDVALKVMNQAMRDDPALRGRFEREARTVATLEHPAIVPVYDFGEDDAQLYLVMRYMSGGSLADRIQARPFALPDLLPIMRRVGAALDHAHRQGVVHRDLKPGNILFDQYDNAFLSDFGIVKLAQEATDLTGSGVIGTPAYMSPEQIHGEKQLDGRSDIYMLGVILFESLTGRKPFEAETPVKQLMAHVLEPTPSILTVRPDLPPACDTIIQKALAKDRTDRFSSASELTEALTITLTTAHPPVARPVGVSEMEEEPEGTVTIDIIPATAASEREASPLPPAPDLVSPPLPRTEPPTQVGTAALTFEKAAVTPPSVPVAPRQRGRAWLVAGFLLVLLLAMAGGAAILRSLPNEPSPTQPAVFLPEVPPSPTVNEMPVVVTETPTSTAASPSPTAVPGYPTPAISEIGRSAQDAPLNVVRMGSGEKDVVLIGGLHAGFAPGSVQLAEEMITYFGEHPEEIPAGVSLYIIPNANPDSAAAPGQLPGRLNGHGVDLNRNWDCRWTADPLWGGTPQPGLGGSAPMSEPEVQALAEFLQRPSVQAVVFWQGRAALGLSSPGACDDESDVSRPLAQVYGQAAGYRIADFEELVNQEVTGDVTNWLDAQGIPAISVLLPDYRVSDFDHNLPAVLAVLAWAASEAEP